MSRYVGYAYPDGLYILDTLTGKVTKVPTGGLVGLRAALPAGGEPPTGPHPISFAPVGPELGSDSSGAHPRLRSTGGHPNTGARPLVVSQPGMTAEWEPVDEFDAVGEAIAKLGADIARPVAMPPVEVEPTEQDVITTQTIPVAALAADAAGYANDPESGSTQMGVRPAQEADPAAVLKRPPPPGWRSGTGEHGADLAAMADEQDRPTAEDDAVEDVVDETFDEVWERFSLGDDDDDGPVMSSVEESLASAAQRDTLRGMTSLSQERQRAPGSDTEENPFGRANQRTTGVTAAPWSDPVRGRGRRGGGRDRDATPAPEPEGQPPEEPSGTDSEPPRIHRPVPKTDPGLARLRRSVPKTDPGPAVEKPPAPTTDSGLPPADRAEVTASHRAVGATPEPPASDDDDRPTTEPEGPSVLYNREALPRAVRDTQPGLPTVSGDASQKAPSEPPLELLPADALEPISGDAIEMLGGEELIVSEAAPALISQEDAKLADEVADRLLQEPYAAQEPRGGPTGDFDVSLVAPPTDELDEMSGPGDVGPAEAPSGEAGDPDDLELGFEDDIVLDERWDDEPDDELALLDVAEAPAAHEPTDAAPLEPGRRTDFDRHVLVHYPFPVAVSYLAFLTEAEPRQRCRRLVDTFTNLLRLWSFQVASQYLQEPEASDPVVDRLLREQMQRPDLSDLNDLLAAGLRALREAAVTPFARELEEAYNRLEADCPDRVVVQVRYEEAGGRIKFKPVELGKIQALIRYRDGLIYGLPQSDERARAQLEIFTSLLQQVLRASQFMSDYLLYCEEPAVDDGSELASLDTADLMRPREPDVVYGHRLMGAVPPSEPDDLPDVGLDLLEHPVFLLRRGTQQALSLRGFCVLAEPGTAEQAIPRLNRELYLYAGRSRSGVSFQSAGGARVELRGPLALWRYWLDERQLGPAVHQTPAVTRADLASHARRVSEETLAHLTDCGIYLPNATIERRSLNERLVRFDHGDYRALILGGVSGIGKTTLLSQLADVRLERGDVVLFYVAGRLADTDLERRVMADLGLSDLAFEELLIRGSDLFAPDEEEQAAAPAVEPPRLFVIVDGLEAHSDNPEGLVVALDAMVAKASETPWFRVVASIQTSVARPLPLAERFGEAPGGRYFLAEAPGEIGAPRSPIVELELLSPSELRTLYNRYREYRHAVTGDPESSGVSSFRPLTAFDTLDERGSTRELLRVPILLRLAMAAFQGRELPEDLTAPDILGAFLDAVVAEEDNPEGAFPERRAFLMNVVREMDALNRSWLTRDRLYEVGSLESAMRNPHPDSAYTQLVRRGVLVESWQQDRYVVRFASQRLFELLLGKHLEVGLESVHDVWSLALRATSFSSVRGAMSLILLHAATKGRKDLLTESLARIDDDTTPEASTISDAIVDVLDELGRTRDRRFGELLPVVTPEAQRAMIGVLLRLFQRLLIGGADVAADAAAHRAVLLAEKMDDPATTARALLCRARREEAKNQLEDALASFALAREAAEESGDALLAHRINARCGSLLRRQRLLNHAADLLDEAATGLAELGVTGEAARARLEEGEVLAELGDLEAELDRTRTGLELATGVDRSVEARALGKMAWLSLRGGNADDAMTLQERAQSVADAEGDFRTLSSMYNLKGLVSWDQNFGEAASAFVASRDLARRVGDRRAVMVASSNMADLRLLQGHLEEAETLVRQAIRLARDLGDGEQEAWNLGKLSKVALEAGTLTQAQSLAEEALKRNERLGIQRGQAWALGYLAEVGLEHGQMDVARTLVRRAVELSEKAGEMINLTWLWAILGESYLRLHRLEPAETHFKHIRSAGERVGSPYAIATALTGLAQTARLRGEWQQAAELLDRALDGFSQVGSPAGVSLVNRCLGRLYLDQGRKEDADPLLLRAYTVAQELANPRLWAQAHQAIAEVLKELGRVEEAKRRARQALEIRKILDHPLELAESWATLGVCHDLADEHEEASDCLRNALEYAEAMGFEPAMARALWLSASLAIDRGLEAPVEQWAQRLDELSRRLADPLSKALNKALEVRLCARDDDEFKLHNALLEVESAYGVLAAVPSLEYSPTSAYLDGAVFYLGRGRTERCKELAELSRTAAGNRPFPRMEELRGLPKGHHTADFEAVPT